MDAIAKNQSDWSDSIPGMKRTIAAIALSAAALVLGGCSSSDPGTSDSTPTAELGATQTVKGDGWEAEVTVADLVTREMDYYGEIKPERQYRALVAVRSVSGATPLASNAFEAIAADGASLTLSIGGESDDIQAGDIPAGQQRAGMVTWTGKPDIQVSKISYLREGAFPAATWTVPGAPESAPPSRMPNHDEVVATQSAAPAPATSVSAPAVETPGVTQAPAVATARQVTPTYEAPAAVEPQAPIGFTGAPNGAPGPLTGKTVDYCMDQSMYQRGTTQFTDGTTGWTEQCAYGG